jgi:signal transduction histidine kinase
MHNTASTLADDFLLALVHDLRTYVRKSLAGSQLIERSLGDGAEAVVLQRFEQVINANKELDAFLSRLSDYASAGHPSKGRPLPLGTVVESTVLHFPAGSITVFPMPDLAADIIVPQNVGRVFHELIDNALKFSKNGPVSIEIRPEFNKTACVAISDEGIGIAPGAEEHVFELLARLQSRDDYPGFGLGLPICRRIAQSAGANVSLAPNPTGGTRALVTFPTAA